MITPLSDCVWGVFNCLILACLRSNRRGKYDITNYGITNYKIKKIRRKKE